MSAFRLLCTAIALSVLSVTVASAEPYKIDATHSAVVFKIRHLGVGYVFGRFNVVEGTVDVSDDPSKEVFNATVKADSLDTGNGKRDTHLKSPDFFSVKEFPTITFKSKSVKPAGDKKVEVVGDLTLHGKTKEITVTMDRTGPVDTKVGKLAGYDTSFTIKRSDFGMKTMLDAVGDEVTLMISLECDKD